MDQDELQKIFFPYASLRINDVKARRVRFVYYTSAEVAFKIIKNKEIWMRNSKTMNDFMEVEYGFRCLKSVYDGNLGRQLKKTLDSIFPALSQRLEKQFDGWLPHFRNETYLTCVSEHLDAEDKVGRLSMWRAYGGANGVALVFNSQALLSESDALKVYSSPVAYVDEKGFEQEFSLACRAIDENANLLRDTGEDLVLNRLFNMLRFAVLCTKHPGFHEEREWRIVHSPALEPSEFVKKDTQIVQGVPQPIYRIPLRNIPEQGFTGADINDGLDRIIIGPTQYPHALCLAFESLLAEAGIAKPWAKIVVSDIPLRQRGNFG